MSSANSYARLVAVLALFATAAVQAADVRVTITNNAPATGTWLTPLWVGFHDGTFEVFDAGSGASAALESIAEDGDPTLLGGTLAAPGVGGAIGGLLAPGASASRDFSIASDGSNSFLSFAAMLLPTSDFFIGNDNPQAIALAGIPDGTFASASFNVLSVYDAGTEINDFATSAGNPLFGIAGGQGGPNQGAAEGGVVSAASGADFALFLNSAGVNLAPLNFSAYASIATITVETIAAPVPLPAGLPLLASALAGLGIVRRRRQSA